MCKFLPNQSVSLHICIFFSLHFKQIMHFTYFNKSCFINIYYEFLKQPMCIQCVSVSKSYQKNLNILSLNRHGLICFGLQLIIYVPFLVNTTSKLFTTHDTHEQQDILRKYLKYHEFRIVSGDYRDLIF